MALTNIKINLMCHFGKFTNVFAIKTEDRYVNTNTTLTNYTHESGANLGFFAFSLGTLSSKTLAADTGYITSVIATIIMRIFTISYTALRIKESQ